MAGGGAGSGEDEGLVGSLARTMEYWCVCGGGMLQSQLAWASHSWAVPLADVAGLRGKRR